MSSIVVSDHNLRRHGLQEGVNLLSSSGLTAVYRCSLESAFFLFILSFWRTLAACTLLLDSHQSYALASICKDELLSSYIHGKDVA